MTKKTQDSDDLEALFDSIIAANTEEETPVPSTKSATTILNDTVPKSNVAVGVNPMITQIGHMARGLHDTLRELGLDKEIQKATSSIPDARDRLNYVATLTQQAAERVLNATEAAQPVVEKMSDESLRLAKQWDLLFEEKLDTDKFKDMATQTRAFLCEVPKQAKVTNAYLMEIMMAQDFQDLTGQVIKKIIVVTQDFEKQLLSLLLDNAPESVRKEFDTGLLNGPVINPDGRTDVVTNQDQVDDLLASLGF